MEVTRVDRRRAWDSNPRDVGIPAQRLSRPTADPRLISGFLPSQGSQGTTRTPPQARIEPPGTAQRPRLDQPRLRRVPKPRAPTASRPRPLAAVVLVGVRDPVAVMVLLLLLMEAAVHAVADP